MVGEVIFISLVATVLLFVVMMVLVFAVKGLKMVNIFDEKKQ